MKLTKPVAIGLAAGVVAAAFATAVPAFSDPVTNSYVLVGSDTLQDSANALVNGTNVTGSFVRIKADGASLGSYDAFGSAKIQTKPGGPYFTRPAGSGDGVSALSASIQNTTFKGTQIGGQVDIARSSGGPGSNAAPTDGKLAYVPYARDAVSYAFNGDASKLGSLTKDQLNQIYAGTLTSVNGVSVTPLLPQSSSGTRKFFLSAIGISNCTISACNDTTTPENDGSVLKSAGQIIPFSSASWVAQSNGAGPNTIPASGDVKLGSPDGTAPYSGSGSALVPNPTFYGSSVWGRDTYLVVEWARINPSDSKYDPKLAGLVKSSNATSLTNFDTTPTAAGAVKQKFGFVAPSTTTITRAYTTLP